MKNTKILIVLSVLITLMFIIPSSFATDLYDDSQNIATNAVDESLSISDTNISDSSDAILNNDKDKSIGDSKSLGSGVGDDDGISVNSGSVIMVPGQPAYINGTLYWTGDYAGTEFDYFPVELTYSYVGDDGTIHTGSFFTDDDNGGKFSLDLSTLPNLGINSSPYTITLSCEDYDYVDYTDLAPDSTDVTVNVIEGGNNSTQPPVVISDPEFYVSNDGDDVTGDGSEENPYVSVEKAITVAVASGKTYNIKVKPGTYVINSLIRAQDVNIIGLGDVVFDLNNGANGFDTSYKFSISNIIFINSYGTSYGNSIIKSVSTSGRELNVTNCSFINCTNYAGAVCTYYAGSAKLKVTNCSFINCYSSMNGGAIAVSSSSTANITGSTFMNCSGNMGGAIYLGNRGGMSLIKNCIFINNVGRTSANNIYSTGSITADYNYWASNSKPNSTSVNANVEVNNWVILDVGADLSKVAVGDNVDFTFDLTKSTDGVTNSSLTEALPELKLTLSSSLGTFDNVEVTTVNGVASAIYTAATEGTETVTVSVPTVAETVQFDVISDESGVIYVSTQGSDSTGTGSESKPYATIEKALTQVTDTKNQIYIKNGTYNEYDLEINKNVIIIGESRESTIIDATNSGRIFTIVEGVTVEIKSISLRNGKPDYSSDSYSVSGKGGAILVDYGYLILNNTNVSNTGSAAGAVASIAGAAGNVTVINSVFENNYLDEGAFEDGYFDILGGAAIYSDSNLVVIDSIFNNNIADADDGDNTGGAIFAANSLNVTGSTFANNSAQYGGAISIDAYDSSNLIISDNVFKNNTATYGGAIHSSKSKLTDISANEFDGNKATLFGGAIYVFGISSVDEISDNNFTNNTALNGAAIYIRYSEVTLRNNYMVDNKASNRGNSIYIDDASVNANLTFLSNSTVTVGGGSEVNLTASLTDDMGNSITNANISFVLVDGNVETIIGSAITDSNGIATLKYDTNDTLATYLITGTFKGSSQDYPTTLKTGLLEVSKYYWFIGFNGYFTLQDAVDASEEGDVITGLPGSYAYEEISIGDRMEKIYKNVTIKADNLGDIILTGVNGRLFNVAAKHAYDDNHRPSSLTLINMIIENCTDDYGGAIYNDAYLTLRNCIFRNNTATNNDPSSKWHGGAIMSWGVVDIDNCTFANNTATSAAAINTEYLHGDGNVSITNTIFENNVATDVGGAIYAAGTGKPCIIENCTFVNNSALSGGAIYSYADTFINNVIFINNTATTSGGAITLVYHSLNLNNVTIEGSTAQYGGALFLAPAITSIISDGVTTTTVNTYNITNSNFNNNNATIDGAVINAGFRYIPTGFIDNCNFTNNHALGNGGVLTNFVGNCTITKSNFINNTGGNGILFNSGFRNELYEEYYAYMGVYDSVFENNVATNGGAIYNNNSYAFVVLRDSNFTNCNASEYGGVIYNDGFLDLSNNLMTNVGATTGKYIYNNGEVRTSYLTFLNNETIEVSLYESSTVVLNVTVCDDMGNPITGRTIIFEVNGTVASSEIDVVEGFASYEYTIPGEGEYEITGVYSGSDEGSYVVKAGHIITYLQSNTEFVIDNSTLFVGDNFVVKLVDDEGNGIANQTVSLNIASNGVTTSKDFITDENGVISLSNLSAGDYNIVGNFVGNKDYLASNFTYNLTVNKLITTITISSIGKSFTAELSNGNTPLVGKNLNVKLMDSKGQVITRTLVSDDNGAISISDLAKGNYFAFVEFAGDDVFAYTNASLNVVISDDDIVIVKHTGNGDALDIQAAIDAANPGAIIYLGDYDYVDVADVNITKNITLLGVGGTTITSAGDGTPIFNILPSSDGVEKVNITGITFNVNNKDVIALATAENGSDPLSIVVPEININNNTVVKVNEDVVAESVTVLKLDSERGSLAPTNPITVKGNFLVDGVKPFEFNVVSVVNGSDVDVPIGGGFSSKVGSVIEYQNMTTEAVATVDGRVGKMFRVVLKDANGNLLTNKAIQIGFNGKVYDRVTDDNGAAELQINLAVAGGYTFAICFLGDDEYNASFAVARITVVPQNLKVAVPNKVYKAYAKTKTLTATVLSNKGGKIAGIVVTFKVNGKTYTAKTDAKGVAKVNVSLTAKKTYSFTVSYAGGNKYAKFTKTAKVTIN